MDSAYFVPISIVISALTSSVADGKAYYKAGEQDPGRDRYYDNETPADWVDILFIIIIAYHHLEYSFKFTDYSLFHLNSKKHKLDEEETQELAELNGALDIEKGHSTGKSIMEQMGVFHIFSTTSSPNTKKRAQRNKLCCCVSWSPRFFTWQRTYVIRTFLKLYMCISCLLAMVLYVEFFMNLLVEFFITCIVNINDFYPFALVILPILLFVCGILIRLSWQAVVISWSISCDRNGDIESLDDGTSIAALQKQLVSSRRLLYSYTDGAREDDWYEQRSKANTVELATISPPIESDAGDNNNNHLKVTNDAVAERAPTPTTPSETPTSPLELNDPVLTPRSKREETQRIKSVELEKEIKRLQMGDYFMGTCWRLGFFVYSMIAACLGAWSIDVEVAVNGFFWQLCMRYMVLGGVVWTITYSVAAFIVAVASRFRSWYLIHTNIPRYKLFLLVDAYDLERKNKGWTRTKMIIMATSLIIFVLFVIISWVFIDETWSSFIHFVGIIFALYYSINLFMACKPFALAALWTDAIPPPGKAFKAHQIAMDSAKEKGMLKESDQKTVESIKDSLEKEMEAHEKLKVPKAFSYSKKTSDSVETPPEEVEEEETVEKAMTLNVELFEDDDQTKTTDDKPVSQGKGTPENATKLFPASFSENRAKDIERRYEAFSYVYKDISVEDYKHKTRILWLFTPDYMRDKAQSFFYNYEQYWLNVYRPFDEYDIESNLASADVLNGFKWLRGICKFCSQSRGKSKTAAEKCFSFFKYLMDNFCNICIVITVFVFMYTLLSMAQRLSGNKDAYLNEVRYETNNTAYYGICSDKFGALEGDEFIGKFDLSVLDVTALSQIVYEADNYDLCQVIDVYFNGTFEIIKINREEPFYFHIRHKTAPLDFIAVRGTDNVIEMMQDLSLFVEVGIFQQLSWVVPFLNAMPISFIRQIIYYGSYIEGVINSQARAKFDEPLYQYVAEYLSRLESGCSYESDTIENWNGPTTLYLVGHSLGGGISQIVAANLHENAQMEGFTSTVQSFGVCSPGTLLSSAKFGFGVEALDETSSSLLPRRDLVSMVDDHGGSVQYTECDTSNMLQCHTLDNVLCELFYGCSRDLAGPIKKRWFVDFCQTSEAQKEGDSAQFGKSILKSGYNITEVTDFSKDQIVKKCDNGVYEKCVDVNANFTQSCSESFADYDICFSENLI